MDIKYGKREYVSNFGKLLGEKYCKQKLRSLISLKRKNNLKCNIYSHIREKAGASYKSYVKKKLRKKKVDAYRKTSDI